MGRRGARDRDGPRDPQSHAAAVGFAVAARVQCVDSGSHSPLVVGASGTVLQVALEGVGPQGGSNGFKGYFLICGAPSLPALWTVAAA